jgi:hypothetical protein
MCDRLVRKGLIRRHRARADCRAVQVSVTAAGRAVVDQATECRRALLAGILGKLPARQLSAIAGALRAFAAAAGEIPDSQRPADPPPELQPPRLEPDGTVTVGNIRQDVGLTGLPAGEISSMNAMVTPIAIRQLAATHGARIVRPEPPATVPASAGGASVMVAGSVATAVLASPETAAAPGPAPAEDPTPTSTRPAGATRATAML